jgi:Helix-turn-helix domain
LKTYIDKGFFAAWGNGGEAFPSREFNFHIHKEIEMNYSKQHQIKREHVTTAEAAEMLCRSPQTLRKWACDESGPIRPIRVHGRLAWRIDELEIVRNGGRVINQNGRKTNYMRLGLVAA